MRETRPTELAREARNQMARALADLDRPTRRCGWPEAEGAGTGGAASLGFCQIESAIGTTPPFLYVARAVTPNGSGGFGAPAGDDFDLYNPAEIGAGGTGVHEVPVGSIVAYWQDAASESFFFDRSFYRGTY